MPATRLRVTGTVQGVGFRPFVYRHAVGLGLRGFVRNDSAGVLIEVEGSAADIAELMRLLTDEAPPLARVTSVVCEAVASPIQTHDPSGANGGNFRIEESDASGMVAVPVSTDTATCAACLAEIDDPSDRRYRYPFTNCTDCGPRYTIVLSVPYDRPATTMAGFTMCEACQAEYDDPLNRRFHAQPNACPVCGPHLVWRAPDGATLAQGEAALDAAIDALRSGRILAIKGIGGYHLAVDATSEAAVAELRRRKARDDKPFAVLATDLDAARRLVVLSEAGEAALVSPGRPIVLARKRGDDPTDHERVVEAVAPGLGELGLMLPYSPMHHLLARGVGRPLVLTSGNVRDEPIAHDDDDAVSRIGSLADAILAHDRRIHIRCDDSVVRDRGGRPGGGSVQTLRRSRGHAPEPIALPFASPEPVLAVGAEMKSTIAVARDRMVVASHHIGDLEHLANYRSFLQAVDHLCHLSGVEPQLVAHDMHPEYLSSKWARDLDVDLMPVQHHHAHVAACLVEHGRTEPVLAIAFDGLGYGPDGSLWGGEFLVADLGSSVRVGHLRQVPMPGGVAAIREPWRMAAVWAAAAEAPPATASGAPAQAAAGVTAAVGAIGRRVERDRVAAVLDLAGRPGTAVTSSAGRLFDAVAVTLGARTRVSYEAQAAIELEALAQTVERNSAPRYEGSCVVATDAEGMHILDPAALLSTVLAERNRGTDYRIVAAGFHEALGQGAADLAIALASRHRLDSIVLTGGVFQNARFSAVVEDALTTAGLVVLGHERVPPNDGGISIGQAAIAAWSRRDDRPTS